MLVIANAMTKQAIIFINGINFEIFFIIPTDCFVPRNDKSTNHFS